MINFKNVLIAIVLSSFTPTLNYGQGCSDAGFCTINSFKPNVSDQIDPLNNQIKLGAFYGQADYDIGVYGNYLEYNRQMGDQFGLSTKITTLAQNGNGISTFGFADLFINTTYKPTTKTNITFGVKIPLTDASKSLDGLPLPMDYQASLGTYDLIFGMGYTVGLFQIIAALQQPISQNENAFIADRYPANSELNSFQTTNQFERSGDVLLRVSYPFDINSKLKLTPGLLPIYHLTNDKYTDAAGVQQEIAGSKGLTLNGNVFLDYVFNSKNSLQLNIGLPFIVRDARPDGLTRSFIANLEYSFRF